MENSLPIPPILFAEIVLLFDHDFPIEQIDTLLGLHPSESKRQSQTRVNPLTKKNNPGFWVYRTKTVSSFDLRPLLQEIDNFLIEHASELHHIIQLYSPCCVLLRYRVSVRQENEYPVIRFNPEMLQRISSLNASIDIDIESDAMLSEDEFL